jgi:hypothetical protein
MTNHNFNLAGFDRKVEMIDRRGVEKQADENIWRISEHLIIPPGARNVKKKAKSFFGSLGESGHILLEVSPGFRLHGTGDKGYYGLFIFQAEDLKPRSQMPLGDLEPSGRGTLITAGFLQRLADHDSFEFT